MVFVLLWILKKGKLTTMEITERKERDSPFVGPALFVSIERPAQNTLRKLTGDRTFCLALVDWS